MAKSKSPEELSHFWDAETAEAWNNLNPKQQNFLLAWINNNFNATQAYWDTYEKSATERTAASYGSQLLRNLNIQTICGKMSNDRKSDFILIKKVYKDAMQANKPVFKDGEMVMEVEDHPTRTQAAEKLAKLNGELSDRVEHSSDPDKPLIAVIERVIVKSKTSD